MLLFKFITCMLFGHKKLKEIENDYHAPFGIGHKNSEYYPLWACNRCNCMYVVPEKIKSKELRSSL